MSKVCWYALRAQSEREDKIKESLEVRLRAKGIEDKVKQIVVPSESIAEVKKGKRSISKQKMFPGYIMIEMEVSDEGELNLDVWFTIMETSGISGFVSADPKKPEPLDDWEVKRILEDIEARKEKPRPKLEFEPGMRVRIKEGPFENYDGSVESVDLDKGMLTVRVSIFGRETSMELEYNLVEKI